MNIILSGVGGVGKNVTRLLSARPNYNIVAAYTRNQDYEGLDLGTHAGVDSINVNITRDRKDALETSADLLLIATTSFLKDVEDDIRTGVKAGLNVLTTAEEAAYPWIIDAKLADDLHQLAIENQVSIIGLGLNPGFIYDALLLTASAIAWDIKAIKIRRVVDISRFSRTIQRRLGIGFTDTEFQAGVKADTITGHIGFPQSFHLAARSMGKTIDGIDKAFTPLIADREYSNDNLEIDAGTTGGFIQNVTALVNEKPWMMAEFIAHVDPNSVGYQPSDSIIIDGYNPLNLTIEPGCQPQLGTAGMIANTIPRVIQAKPGFITVADLAIPYARETNGSFD